MNVKLSFNNFPRMDAGESLMLNQQLTQILAEVYQTEFPALRFRELIPVSSEVNPGAKNVTYRQYTKVGMMKFLANGAKDLPRVDVYAQEFTSPLASFGGAYGYTDDDLMAAAFAGVPLESELGSAAALACETMFNTVALLGDTTLSIPGFLNNANVTIDTLIADGTGSSKAWTAKTSAQIARDFNQIVNKVITQSKGMYIPNTVALPLAAYTHIASTPWSGNSDTTILAWLLKNNPNIKEITWLNELLTAGATSNTRAVVYWKDPSVLKAHISQEFTQYPPQEQGLEVIVPCKGKTGGTIIPRPLAVVYADGL